MSRSPKKQICLIEDHQDYRRVLRLAIQASDRMSCSHSFSSIEACLQSDEGAQRVDVILLDLGLPGVHGVAGIPLLLARFPDVKILVLTVNDRKPVVLEALAAGANGYLLKADSLERIIEGINEILQDGAPLNGQIAKMILTTFRAVRPAETETDLTTRERETLEFLSQGLIKKEVAEKMGVSYHTIDTHVRNIYGKLQVHNISGAVNEANKLGLL